MKDRLISKGLVTTILGIVIIVFCAVMIWFGKSTTQEMSGWFGTAILLIRSKDTILGINNKENDIEIK
jgi:hypothetical protein